MIDTKIYALYLPQYYETNYNSEWWGEGYTEWTACKQAKPLFSGHQQPKLPLDNHFYDLSKLEEISLQCEQAKQYGIDGFIIYQYYSCNDSKHGVKNGKHGSMLLTKPTEIIRDNDELDIDYCLYWANHDWRKAWFGQDPKMLWPQLYGDEKDWKEFYDYNVSYFKDKRYIKIDNKPVFFIFATWHFNDIEKFINCWNKWAVEDGFNGVYFIKTDDAHTKKELSVYNATYHREPFFSFANCFSKSDFVKRAIQRKGLPILNKLLKYFNYGFISYKCNYEKLWKAICSQELLGNKIIPGCIADWDNTARKGYNGQILTNVSIAIFRKYLSQLYDKCKRNNVPFMVINAWNEWAEGAYLEPDSINEFKYLEVIKDIKK